MSTLAAHRLAVRWVGAAFVFLALGCGGCREETPPAGSGNGEPARHPATAPATPRRSGVKVPLPEGWTARAASEELLAVGPAGRDVLRIELRPGRAAQLPTAEALVASMGASLEGVQVETVDAKTEPDRALAVLRLTRATDGGAPRTTLALLGAKRVAGDLFLCSTTPGASEEDVKAAAAACGALNYADGRPATSTGGR